jgi:hypothetical protein
MPGYGRGGGRGWRHWYHAAGLPGWMRWGYGPVWGAPLPPEQEVASLRTQAEALKSQLDAISQRIAELEQE